MDPDPGSRTKAVQTVSLGEAGIMDAATAADEEKYLTIKLPED